MYRFKKSVLSGLLVGTLLAVSACSGNNAAGDVNDPATEGLTTVKVAWVPAGGTMAFALGEEKGIFEDHGIKIEYAPPAQNSVLQISQILNGQVDVGFGSITGVISANSKKLPVQAISSFQRDFNEDDKTNYSVLVPENSDIEQFTDLNGKNVAVNSLQGTWDTAVKEAVSAAGGDPSSINFVNVPFSDQATALAEGHVDAAYTLQPFVSTMLQAGNRSIGDAQAAALGDEQGGSDVMFTSKKLIQDNPELVKSLVAGLTEASKYAKEHPEELRAMLSEKTGIPAEIVNNAPMPNYTTVMPQEMAQKWIDLLVKYEIIAEPVDVEEVLWAGAPTE